MIKLTKVQKKVQLFTTTSRATLLIVGFFIIIFNLIITTTTVNGLDLFRAIKTATFFDAVPLPKLPTPEEVMKNPARIFLRPPEKKNINKVVPSTILYTPKDNSLNWQWGPLDDVVMGGQSESTYNMAKGLWEGQVSDIGGGFVGVRTKNFDEKLDCSNAMGLRIKIKSDGKRYKMVIRDDDAYNGPSWCYSFDTKPNMESMIIDIPFSDLILNQQSRIIPQDDTNKFNKAEISAIQFLHSKFEYGNKLNPSYENGKFQFEIEEVSVY